MTDGSQKGPAPTDPRKMPGCHVGTVTINRQKKKLQLLEAWPMDRTKFCAQLRRSEANSKEQTRDRVIVLQRRKCYT